MDLDPSLQQFLIDHKLPDSYQTTLQQWFVPLSQQIADQQRQQQRPLRVAINGSQGSGKTTLADALVMLLKRQGLTAIALSIDDFYRTRAERQQLASDIHPLLITRGVPGTHDVALAEQVIQQLTNATSATQVAIPRFNKAMDDRQPANLWDHIKAPLDVVIFEGWCVCSPAEDDITLGTPVNELEALEDSNGDWRRYVNQQNRRHYQTLYEQFDVRIMLKAPSFDVVYQWRLEQEHKLAAKHALSGTADGIMSDAEISRFIQHYQRITENTLAHLPAEVDFLYELDQHRRIVNSHARVEQASYAR